jgi:hypothetical protein
MRPLARRVSPSRTNGWFPRKRFPRGDFAAVSVVEAEHTAGVELLAIAVHVRAVCDRSFGFVVAIDGRVLIELDPVAFDDHRTLVPVGHSQFGMHDAAGIDHLVVKPSRFSAEGRMQRKKRRRIDPQQI